MFENRVLMRIFGPKSDEITTEWRKLRNEELNELYSTPNIFRVTKIEKNEMGGTCSAYRGRGEVYTWFWWGNLREIEHLGDPRVDGG